MKKLLFLLGGVVGFLIGSRLGRGPYEAVEQQVRRFSHRPDVPSDTDEADSLSSTTSPITGAVTDTTPSAADTLQ